MRFLLERCADLEAQNDGYSTALRLATELRKLVIVQLLLAHASCIMARVSKNVWTPLHFGNPDVVRLLSGSGADLEAQSDIVNTARAFHSDLS